MRPSHTAFVTCAASRSAIGSIGGMEQSGKPSLLIVGARSTRAAELPTKKHSEMSDAIEVADVASVADVAELQMSINLGFSRGLQDFV